MLEAARAKRAEGLDVASAWSRPTAGPRPARLLEGLEIIPRRAIEYRGTRLEEFDLDAALARHPALLLVDELAHTNAPGLPPRQALAGRRGAARRRHQRLHHAQHPAPREPQRRRRPDHRRQGARDGARLGARAGRRGRAGGRHAGRAPAAPARGQGLRPRAGGPRHRAVLPQGQPDRAARAGAPAHGRAGGRPDARLHGRAGDPRDLGHGASGSWSASGPSPTAARLVRATRRMAARLHADWFAVHVETPRDQRLSAAEREDILRAMELAEQLGGRAGHPERPERRRGDPGLRPRRTTSPGSSWARPARPRWRELLRGSLLDALVRGSGGIEVLAITGEEEEDAARAPAPAAARRSTLAASTPRPRRSSLVPTARRPAAPAGRRYRCRRSTPPCCICSPWSWRPPASAAGRRSSPSLVGIASFDFFFVHPFYTFSVADVRYVLTFGVMLVVALVMGNLTGRIRSQAEAAREREQRTSALYAPEPRSRRAPGPGRGARRGPAEPARHLRDRCGGAAARRGGRA